MRTIATAGIMIAALISNGTAWAYGGGGGGSSGCAEPKFFEPTPQGTVSSLSEFGFIASDNTDAPTLTVEIAGNNIKPKLDRRRSGDWQVKATLPQPITAAGKVRIGVKAKSTDGCWGFQPYSVDITP